MKINFDWNQKERSTGEPTLQTQIFNGKSPYKQNKHAQGGWDDSSEFFNYSTDCFERDRKPNISKRNSKDQCAVDRKKYPPTLVKCRGEYWKHKQNLNYKKKAKFCAIITRRNQQCYGYTSCHKCNDN